MYYTWAEATVLRYLLLIPIRGSGTGVTLI